MMLYLPEYVDYRNRCRDATGSDLAGDEKLLLSCQVLLS